MAQQRPPSLMVSLVLFVAGAILAYYVLRTNGLSSGIALQQVWSGLSMGMRALAVAGFIASAYGLGAVISNLTRKKN